METQNPHPGGGAPAMPANGANGNSISSPEIRENAFQGEGPVLDIHEKVMRPYEASLSAFNSGNWDAAVSLCGKALENIARGELSFTEHSGSLAQLMERLVHQINTDRPFLELSSALKDGGGLAEHFNLERCSSREVASATIDLIECFVNYIFLFRTRLKKLIKLVQPGPDEVLDLTRGSHFPGQTNSNGNGHDHSEGKGNGNGNGNGANLHQHRAENELEEESRELDASKDESPALFGHR